MSKKYLDFEGLQYLWSKIDMQDYPNNETLIAVIQAIDETKADRTELDTNKIIHNNFNLYSLLETYLLNIDYNELTFNTSEIIFDNKNSTPILGKAILGQMVLV